MRHFLRQAAALAWLKEAGVWVVGADAGAPRSLYQTKLAPPVALVLGGVFTGMAVGLRRDPTAPRAMRLFGFSITYLVLLFGAMAADVLI